MTSLCVYWTDFVPAFLTPEIHKHCLSNCLKVLVGSALYIQ